MDECKPLNGGTVLDLGCHPGAWLQVACQSLGAPRAHPGGWGWRQPANRQTAWSSGTQCWRSSVCCKRPESFGKLQKNG